MKHEILKRGVLNHKFINFWMCLSMQNRGCNQPSRSTKSEGSKQGDGQLHWG